MGLSWPYDLMMGMEKCWSRVNASPNVLWITLESIRYDHTSLSGYHRNTTPSLQRIAADQQAHSFSNCISHGKWTGTSSASILTGTTPPTHGVYGASNLVVSDDLATVPELLPDEYSSVSLISNPNAGPAKGLDRGFDEVKYVTTSTLRESVGLRTMAKSVPQLWRHGGGITTDVERHKGLTSYMTVDAAKRFAKTQDNPYFMYLHLNSSHHPYLPPASRVDDFTDDMSPETALETTQSRYEDIHELIASGGLTDDELNAVESMYDAVVSHIDYCVGQLVDAVQQQDGETVIIIIGDHGDLLGEYDLAGHKFALHDGLTHVPLVTYGLNGVADQTEEVVQPIDIMKTVFSQIGVENEQFEGIDLTQDRRQFAVTQRSGENAQKNLRKIQKSNPDYRLPVGDPKTLTAVRSQDHKLLYSEDSTELFALPDETTDVKEQYPELHEQMVSYISNWLTKYDSGAATEREQELDPNIKDHLSDMGYLDSG